MRMNQITVSISDGNLAKLVAALAEPFPREGEETDLRYVRRWLREKAKHTVLNHQRRCAVEDVPPPDIFEN
jgi:multimeric flavodoxin WrbA